MEERRFLAYQAVQARPAALTAAVQIIIAECAALAKLAAEVPVLRQAVRKLALMAG
jgi:hypothetical protein